METKLLSKKLSKFRVSAGSKTLMFKTEQNQLNLKHFDKYISESRKLAWFTRKTP